MVSNSQTARLLGVVLRRLRKDFQDDFYKRCFYAASIMRALLVEAGVETEIVGGDFVAFTVSRYGARVGMLGFGFGGEQCSHFRVVAGGACSMSGRTCCQTIPDIRSPRGHLWLGRQRCPFQPFSVIGLSNDFRQRSS